MTDSFKINFNSEVGSSLDLQSIGSPMMKSEKISLDKMYKIGAKIPLNSWFQFNRPVWTIHLQLQFC